MAPAMKVALVDPAATTTGELTATRKLLLEIATDAPPAGAGDVSEIVHVLLPLGAIVAGVQTRLDKAAAAG